jgi:hypothetical protein
MQLSHDIHSNINVILDLAESVIVKASIDDMQDELEVLNRRRAILEDRLATEKPKLESMRSKVEETFASRGVEITIKQEIDAIHFHNAHKAIQEFESVRDKFNQKLFDIREDGDIWRINRRDILVLLSEFSTTNDLWYDAEQDHDFLFVSYELEHWCKIAIEHMDKFERILCSRYVLASEQFFM